MYILDKDKRIKIKNIDIEELSSVLGLLTKEYNVDLKKIKKN